LRERPDDIPVLAETFLQDAAARNGRTLTAIAPAALQQLQGYAWPGNVRELRNVIERAVLLSDGDTIEPSHLPEGLGAADKTSNAAPAVTLPLGITLDEAERTLILQSLQLTGNNKTRAAAILGINVKTLHNKLTRYLSASAGETREAP